MTAELHSQAVISFLNYYYLCYDLCLSHFAAKLLYFLKIIGSFNPVFNKTKRPFNQSHKIYHKSKPGLRTRFTPACVVSCFQHSPSSAVEHIPIGCFYDVEDVNAPGGAYRVKDHARGPEVLAAWSVTANQTGASERNFNQSIQRQRQRRSSSSTHRPESWLVTKRRTPTGCWHGL